MAYNEKLADRIRQALEKVPKVQEKAMMGGLTFMVNSKMCVGIIKDEMMCRINPDQQRFHCSARGLLRGPQKSTETALAPPPDLP